MIDGESRWRTRKAGFSAYRFKWLSEDDLLAMLPPVFIIDGFLPENTVTILYGKWGIIQVVPDPRYVTCRHHRQRLSRTQDQQTGRRRLSRRRGRG